MAVAVAALWLACFILTYTFPILNAGFGDQTNAVTRLLERPMPWLKHGLGPDGTFWVYAAICALGFVFILLKLPETKGKSLEEIERTLVD